MVWSVSAPQKFNTTHWSVHVLAELIEEPCMQRYARRRTGINNSWKRLDNWIKDESTDTEMYKEPHT